MAELFRRLLARPVLFGELLLASLVLNLLALATSIFSMQVFNRYLTYGVDATLWTLVIGTLIAVGLEFAFREVRHRLCVAVSAGADATLAERAFTVLARARSTALDRLPNAVRQEAMRGLEAIQIAYSPSNVAVYLDIPFALLFLGAIALLSPLLGLLMVAAAALAIVGGLAQSASLQRLSRDAIEASAGRQAQVASAVAAADTVRAFSAAGFLRRQWAERTRRIGELRQHIAGLQNLGLSATTLLSAIAVVGVTAVGAKEVISGNITTGALIGATFLALRALQPISRATAQAEAMGKASEAIRLLTEFGRLPLEPDAGTTLPNWRGAIEFDGVAYVHHGMPAPLFEHLSLRVAPGEFVVITGPNGSGKTTLARLVAGLIEPARGRVLLGGVDLRQIDPAWWRRQIVYVPQEPLFLNASVAENIRVANPDLTDEALARVVNAADLRGWLDSTSSGIGTMIGDQGNSLAMGVRRRLALARALATDGWLAIIDEPTDGFDAAGVAALQNAVTDMMKRGRTVLIFTSSDASRFRGARHVVDLGIKPTPRVTSAPALAPVPAATGTEAKP